jgi:hypothetical protein
MIVQAIDGVQSELLIQAYAFTSEPIIEAVVKAKQRGVDVKIILDKSNEQERYTAATFLKKGTRPTLPMNMRGTGNSARRNRAHTEISGLRLRRRSPHCQRHLSRVAQIYRYH